MNLPIYQIIHCKTGQIEELLEILKPEINHKRPVAIQLSHLPLDQQRESIGMIDNWFEGRQQSPFFPYPVYLVSLYGEAMSTIPVVADIRHLPKFFSHKDGKITVKEVQILNRCKLLQQEIKNTDFSEVRIILERYAQNHKAIAHLEHETEYFEGLLKSLGVEASA
jgi:hypothetical protein